MLVALAKNTLLGIAVFSTYEGIIEYSPLPLPASPRLDYYTGTKDFDSVSNVTAPMADPFANAALSKHASAGFFAGCVHASLKYTLDGLARLRQHVTYLSMVKRPLAVSDTFASMISGAFGNSTIGTPVLPYVLHHATSHMVLFGTYEGTKRLLLPIIADDHHSDKNGDEQEEDDIHYGNLAAVGLAGGVAGSVQHVVGEYTEQLTLPPSSEKIGVPSATALSSSRSFLLVQKLHSLPMPRAPNARALLLALVPSAIGFVAFEYGREVMSDDE